MLHYLLYDDFFRHATTHILNLFEQITNKNKMLPYDNILSSIPYAITRTLNTSFTSLSAASIFGQISFSISIIV